MGEISIAESFRNRTVLVTGGTGFLGKILTEKLLRTCPVNNIAILVRSKKGINAKQRLSNVYKQGLFDRLRKEKPDFMNSIKIIEGDLENLAISSSTDRDWMIENVNFVFHCAATIKFNEPLKVATEINIQGTENLLELATQMKNLKGFVHVSTAYSHCPRNEIKEEFYSVPITAKELKNLISSDELTPDPLEDWPNTYTFTKAIAENVILKNEDNLPISIFRPSIVGCTKNEPVPGWLDNVNGPTGIFTGVMVGFLRTLPMDSNKIADIIPADYTVNALISVMCETAKRYEEYDLSNKEPKIYNYVSGVESPITWKEYIEEMHKVYNRNPPMRSMWYGFYIFYTNLWVGAILRFFLHRLPAVFMDFLLILNRKKPKMLKFYSKSESMIDLLYPFSTEEWKFDNSNTRQLWSSLGQDDRNTFYYSLEKFNWTSYANSYFHGIRKYILNEDLSNLDKALSKNRKLYWFHNLSICLIIYLVIQLNWLLIKYLF